MLHNTAVSSRVEEQSEHLLDRGYAVFAGAYAEHELDAFRAGLMELYVAMGRPSCYSAKPREITPDVHLVPTGLSIAKLLERRPDFAPFLLKSPVVEAIRRVLGEDMVLELTAGVLADRTRPQFLWHTHIGGQDDNRFRASGAWPVVERPQRIGTLLYLQDLTEETGPLLLYPRAAGTATAPPDDTSLQRWDGEVVVSAPRGTLVAMDECTWHSARPMTAPGLRMIVGCNFARASAAPSPVLEMSLGKQEGGELLQSVTRWTSRREAR
jgi:Phytanoyl-CoA dioxygenase (PhyH)